MMSNVPRLEWENLASLLSVTVAVLAMVLLLVGFPPLRWIEPIEASFRRFAAKRSLCLALIPLLSLTVNAAIALHNGIPRPKVHDEFSYLLAADTFAHGRLTNPSPPLFEHFETPHELMQPTRMSKYPPGQGIALMLGQITCGKPIVGAWISTAAACAAIYWMLLAFVRLPWALLGGIVASLNPALLDWSQSYWGGSVAVLGGALLFGAWGRLMMRASIGASIWLGIGLVVLANSRPFEGLLLSVPLLVALSIHVRKHRSLLLVPCGLVLMIAAAWMGYYNYRVTGHFTRMPFIEYSARYDVYPKFWFLPMRPMPVYHNSSQRWLHAVFEKGLYEDLRIVSHFRVIASYRIGAFVMDSLKFAALLPGFVLGLSLIRDGRIRWVIISISAVLLGLLLENYDLQHYSAPATAGILLLAMLGWSRIRQLRWQGKSLALAMAAGWLAGSVMSLMQGPTHEWQGIDQQQLVSMKPELATGRHLIFVQYSPMMDFIDGYQNEYVFNPADMDLSRIIWARHIDSKSDLLLTSHFPGRQIWLLHVGARMDLTPYLMNGNSDHAGP
jgi:hypothetical protein